MKDLILLLIAVVFFGVQDVHARRGIPIPIGTAEHMKHTFNLPDTDNYKTESGKFLDLGVKYEVFEIVWVPVWLMSDPIIVGLEENNTDKYYDLSPEQISEILATNKIEQADVLYVSFWSKYTGLLILIPLLILIIRGYFIKDEEEGLTE